MNCNSKTTCTHCEASTHAALCASISQQHIASSVPKLYAAAMDAKTLSQDLQVSNDDDETQVLILLLPYAPSIGADAAYCM
jgi:hypothetical protein